MRRLPRLVPVGALALAACAQYPPVPKDAWPPNIPASSVAAKPGAAKPGDPECREYHEPVLVEGKLQEAYGTVCRQPNGTWRITQKNDVPPSPQVVPIYPAYPPPPYYPRIWGSTGVFFGRRQRCWGCW